MKTMAIAAFMSVLDKR